MGTPAELIKARRSSNLEDAYISYLEEANETRGLRARFDGRARSSESGAAHSQYPRTHENLVQPAPSLRLCNPRRTGTPARPNPHGLYALLGTAFLMAVFGAGISTDVNIYPSLFSIATFATKPRLSRRATQARAILSKSRRSRPRRHGTAPPLRGHKAAIEIPPDFGRDIKKNVPLSRRCVGGRRYAVSRRNDSRLSPGGPSAISFSPITRFAPGKLRTIHRMICARPCAIRISHCSDTGCKPPPCRQGLKRDFSTIRILKASMPRFPAASLCCSSSFPPF